MPDLTKPHTFAAGWNARCDGLRKNPSESDDWQHGWTLADRASAQDHIKFNRFGTIVRANRG